MRQLYAALALGLAGCQTLPADIRGNEPAAHINLRSGWQSAASCVARALDGQFGSNNLRHYAGAAEVITAGSSGNAIMVTDVRPRAGGAVVTVYKSNGLIGADDKIAAAVRAMERCG